MPYDGCVTMHRRFLQIGYGACIALGSVYRSHDSSILRVRLLMAWIRKLPRSARLRRGVLTLEWILLVTVIVIGIIGGLGVVRNATVGELRDLADAITALNVPMGGGS